MERFKEYNPDQSYFINLDPKIYFPLGSYERFIVDMLENIEISNFYPQDDKGGNTPLGKLKPILSKRGKEICQNITDNDSRIMKIDKKNFKPSNNAQASACGKNGIIVGADVTTEANDKNQLKPMVTEMEEAAPEEIKEEVGKGKHQIAIRSRLLF